MSKILVQLIHISIGRPQNDTHINASNVSSFNRILRSFFTQFFLEYLHLHIVVLAKSKLHSQSCRSYWNLEVYPRVPRVASSYVFICKLQPLHFVIGNIWRGLHYEGWKLCRAHFCEMPNKNKNKIKSYLTAKMTFDRCWRLQYWTLGQGPNVSKTIRLHVDICFDALNTR